MTTDESNSGWDSLAEEFGLEVDKPAAKPEQQTPPPAKPAPRPAATRPAPRPVEIEDEPDEFGAGVAEPEEPALSGALYDPGPDEMAGDDFDDAAPEPLEEEDEGDEVAGEMEGASEGHEGGKRKRRRRRRRKKGGPGAPEPAAEPPDVGEVGEVGEPAEAEEAIVEEGEAPAEVEGDDDEPAPPTAVDEELVAEAAGPRPEWHVMTWMELVAKLYRPN